MQCRRKFLRHLNQLVQATVSHFDRPSTLKHVVNFPNRSLLRQRVLDYVREGVVTVCAILSYRHRHLLRLLRSREGRDAPTYSLVLSVPSDQGVGEFAAQPLPEVHAPAGRESRLAGQYVLILSTKVSIILCHS